MKKNQIFIAAGTVALAIAGFLNAKANIKKFTSPAVTAYFWTSGVGSNIYTLFKGVSSSILTYNLTLTNSGKTAFFKTTGGISGSKVFAVRNTGVNPNTLNTTVYIK